MGRQPETVTKHYSSKYEGEKTVTVRLFTWEELDYVDAIRRDFGIK